MGYAGWVVGCGLCAWFLHHFHFFIAWRFGMRMRVALVTHIMAKALRLSLGSLHSVSVGHVVTLASSDVEKFQARRALSLIPARGPRRCRFQGTPSPPCLPDVPSL